MNLTIELDRETDGRWIAEVPELNVLIYGAGRDEAIRKAEAAAMEIIADRIQRGTYSERPAATSSAPPSSSALA
jgi:predicted RNase H-like HicB family nuclease